MIRSIDPKVRRAAFLRALYGSKEDLLNWVLVRVSHRHITNMVIYGTSVVDPEKQGNLFVRWLDRMVSLKIKHEQEGIVWHVEKERQPQEAQTE